MRCGTARTLLPLLLDESLPPAEHHEVASHFDECPSCAQLKALHEVPPPPLPAIPDCILAQFGRDLDEALDEELAFRDALKRRGGASFGCIQVSRTWMWIYLALLGTATTVAVYGVARLQYSPIGLNAARVAEGPGGSPTSSACQALIDYSPGVMSESEAFAPCTASLDESDEFLVDRPARINWSGSYPASASRYPKTVSTASRLSTDRQSQ